MVMNKVMRVIREAHNTEKKRRKMSQKRKNEDVTKKNPENQDVDILY